MSPTCVEELSKVALRWRRGDGSPVHVEPSTDRIHGVCTSLWTTPAHQAVNRAVGHRLSTSPVDGCGQPGGRRGRRRCTTWTPCERPATVNTRPLAVHGVVHGRSTRPRTTRPATTPRRPQRPQLLPPRRDPSITPRAPTTTRPRPVLTSPRTTLPTIHPGRGTGAPGRALVSAPRLRRARPRACPDPADGEVHGHEQGATTSRRTKVVEP